MGPYSDFFNNPALWQKYINQMQKHVDEQNGNQRKDLYDNDMEISSAATMSPADSFFSPSPVESGWSPISPISPLSSSFSSMNSPLPNYFTPKPPSFSRPEGTYTRKQYKSKGGKRPSKKKIMRKSRKSKKKTRKSRKLRSRKKSRH